MGQSNHNRGSYKAYSIDHSSLLGRRRSLLHHFAALLGRPTPTPTGGGSKPRHETTVRLIKPRPPFLLPLAPAARRQPAYSCSGPHPPLLPASFCSPNAKCGDDARSRPPPPPPRFRFDLRPGLHQEQTAAAAAAGIGCGACVVGVERHQGLAAADAAVGGCGGRSNDWPQETTIMEQAYSSRRSALSSTTQCVVVSCRATAQCSVLLLCWVHTAQHTSQPSIDPTDPDKASINQSNPTHRQQSPSNNAAPRPPPPPPPPPPATGTRRHRR